MFLVACADDCGVGAIVPCPRHNDTHVLAVANNQVAATRAREQAAYCRERVPALARICGTLTRCTSVWRICLFGVAAAVETSTIAAPRARTHNRVAGKTVSARASKVRRINSCRSTETQQRFATRFLPYTKNNTPQRSTVSTHIAFVVVLKSPGNATRCGSSIKINTIFTAPQTVEPRVYICSLRRTGN